MLRTIQYLSILVGAISLAVLAQNVLHLEFAEVFETFLATYERLAEVLLGWAKPFAEAVADYLGLELPSWWKNAVILYTTMGGATVRSGTHLFALFSAQLRVLQAREREELRSLEDEYDAALEKLKQPGITKEESQEAARMIRTHDLRVMGVRHKFRIERERYFRSQKFAGYARLAATVFWPVVWILDLVMSALPSSTEIFENYRRAFAGEQPIPRQGWGARLKSSFAVNSLREFSLIVIGACIFVVLAMYDPL